jgi:hypothetical protein
MAEIHVEAKKRTTPAWIWIVIALVVLGVIAYILLRNKKADESNVGKPNTTSYIQDTKAVLSYV